MPVAVLMHLIQTHKEQLSAHRVLAILMEHEDFGDAVASLQVLDRYQPAPRLELVPPSADLG